MKIPSLFMFPYGTNEGYAISAIETLFYRAGLELSEGDEKLVHFSYPGFDKGHPESLPVNFSNLTNIDFSIAQNQPSMKKMVRRLVEYVRANRIQFALFVDVQPIHPMFRPLRLAGVKTILSYCGAPISSMMPAWKLLIKRLEMHLSISRVDGMIFESHAMAKSATHGRGVPKRMIDVVPLGVDCQIYTPKQSDYVYKMFSFPRDRKVAIYAGHMEKRKGVHILVEAAIELLLRRNRGDVCFLLCGNREGESREYERLYEGMGLDHLIQFGGYRSDLPEIYPSCFCGAIPSSGWDSYTQTSLEMAASGLPVIASRLGGLPEAILDGKTGLLFDPGNVQQLADRMESLLEQPSHAARLGQQGHERCVRDLNLTNQVSRIIFAFRRHVSLAGI